MLDKVKKKEAKDALKKGNKQIQNDDDDDDSEISDDDSDSDDDDDIDDKIGEAQTQFDATDGAKGKRSRSNSNSMSQGDMTVDEKGDGLGFTGEEAKDNGNKNSDDLSSDEDYDCQVSKDCYFDLTLLFYSLNSPL